MQAVIPKSLLLPLVTEREDSRLRTTANLSGNTLTSVLISMATMKCVSLIYAHVLKIILLTAPAVLSVHISWTARRSTDMTSTGSLSPSVLTSLLSALLVWSTTPVGLLVSLRAVTTSQPRPVLFPVWRVASVLRERCWMQMAHVWRRTSVRVPTTTISTLLENNDLLSARDVPANGVSGSARLSLVEVFAPLEAKVSGHRLTRKSSTSKEAALT